MTGILNDTLLICRRIRRQLSSGAKAQAGCSFASRAGTGAASPPWDARLRAHISGHVSAPGVHVLCVHSEAAM